MTRQLKFILILVVLVVILLIGAGVIAYLYWQANTSSGQTNTNTPVVTNVNSTNEAAVSDNANVNTAVETPAEKAPVKTLTDEQMLQQLAYSFTERYGSFSNQNDFENLLNLKIYMTKKMQEEVDDFIAENKNKVVEEDSYYGITTKTLSIKQLSLEGDKALYRVSAQRNEARGLTGANKTYTQEALLEFKKTDGQWKVHAFTWE